MHAKATVDPVYVSSDGVYILDGYGIEVKVERGHLIVADGIGPLRRRSRFSRATAGIRRVVLLGHTGFVTLDAIRWLDDVGAVLVHIDQDGVVLVSSARHRSNDARLRRAQGRVWGSGAGIELARTILERKLDGQSALVARHGRRDLANVIGAARALLRQAVTDPAELLVPEAAAAAAYWSAWADLQVTWARMDAARVPQHWQRFGARRSPITGHNRLAANPANAMLNYCYSLLEAEVRSAVLTVGLDPGLGVLHADQRGRDSLVLDLMEPLRPEVDAFVLDLVRTRTLRASDFHETRQGSCRLLAPLTHELASTLGMWRTRVAPVVESAARDVASMSTRPHRVATPLTESNRSKGRGVRGPRMAAERRHPEIARAACLRCATPVAPARRYCDACRPDVDVFRTIGTRALRQRRDEGADPAHGGEVARIRGEKWRERQRLEAEWEREHGKADPNDFRAAILPSLRSLPPRTLVEATGLTRAYCSRIIKGAVVPHPRWWSALAGLRKV